MKVMRIQVRGLLSENVAVDCYANATLLFTEFMVSVSKRQAFSSRFSRKFHECLPRGRETPLVAFTGGLRTYATINSALASGHAEPVGIGTSPYDLTPRNTTTFHHRPPITPPRFWIGHLAF